MEANAPYYEVKPMPVLVPSGTMGWCGTFLQAVRHVWLRVLATLLISAALFVASLKWPHAWRPLGHTLLEHVGIVSMASGIVIFAFELVSEVKHSLDPAVKLANSLNKHIQDVFNGSAREAVSRAMQEPARAQCGAVRGEFCLSAQSLSSVHQGGWAAPRISGVHRLLSP